MNMTIHHTELMLGFSKRQIELMMAWNSHFHKVSSASEEARREMDEIMRKCRVFLDYRISFDFNDAAMEYMRKIFSMVDDIVKRYYDTRGDTSLLLQYDDLKKEALSLSNTLGDMESRLVASFHKAEEEVKVLRDRIAMELKNEKIAASNTEADRMARVDARYTRALDDMLELESISRKATRKLDIMRMLVQGSNQSVSTAKIGMIQDSNTINEYNKGKEVMESRQGGR